MTITLSIAQLLLLIVVAIGAGFFIRTQHIRKKQTRIMELENEMISNHAEILKLHQEISSLKQTTPTNTNVPVVPLKQDQSGGDAAASFKKRAY